MFENENSTSQWYRLQRRRGSILDLSLLLLLFFFFFFFLEDVPLVEFKYPGFTDLQQFCPCQGVHKCTVSFSSFLYTFA